MEQMMQCPSCHHNYPAPLDGVESVTCGACGFIYVPQSQCGLCGLPWAVHRALEVGQPSCRVDPARFWAFHSDALARQRRTLTAARSGE